MSSELILAAALVGAGVYITYLLRRVALTERVLEGVVTGAIKVVPIDVLEDDDE